jgi:hypothetical protein
MPSRSRTMNDGDRSSWTRARAGLTVGDLPRSRGRRLRQRRDVDSRSRRRRPSSSCRTVSGARGRRDGFHPGGVGRPPDGRKLQRRRKPGSYLLVGGSTLFFGLGDARRQGARRALAGRKETRLDVKANQVVEVGREGPRVRGGLSRRPPALRSVVPRGPYLGPARDCTAVGRAGVGRGVRRDQARHPRAHRPRPQSLHTSAAMWDAWPPTTRRRGVLRQGEASPTTSRRRARQR